MELRFTKMHGLGNDFVVIEDLDESLDLAPEAVSWLADRNFGVGGDGVILVRPASTPGADHFMLYYNADGSTAEMCGNGIRCFAKYLVERGLVPTDRDTLRIQTLGGVKTVQVTRADDGTMHMATVDMGVPVLAAADVPTTLPGDPVIEAALSTGLGTVHVTCVSMSNPHAILWVDDVDDAPVDELGPMIETDDAFPNRTNVEFAHVNADGDIELRVWERGVGETLACGTGACATLVAAVLGGRIHGRSATILLPGGELAISWESDDAPVLMTGPAAEVFSGTVTVPENDR